MTIGVVKMFNASRGYGFLMSLLLRGADYTHPPGRPRRSPQPEPKQTRTAIAERDERGPIETWHPKKAA
jgi:hypothetical protein